MLEQVAAYLRNMGYTVEEQGKIEKYLVVFRDGRPIGFILSDLSAKLVSGTEEQDGIRKMIAFFRENQDFQSVGKGEYVLINFCGHQLTTFFDRRTMSAQYAAYVRDSVTGEVSRTLYTGRDEAVCRFIVRTQMIDLKKLAPPRESLRQQIRSRLIRYLLSKSDQEGQAEAAPPDSFRGGE